MPASAGRYSGLAPTYENALHLLSLLPTNKDVTSLFAGPPAPSSSSSSTGPPLSKDDLNAQAIPEMLTWLRRAGYAQSDLAALRCVHVAGTKGKGSVCAFVTALLVRRAAATGAKEKVGTYMSPHVASVRERIWIDGAPVSREMLARGIFDVWRRLSLAAADEAAAAAGRLQKGEMGDELVDGPASKPFYFRFLTLVAFHLFLTEGVTSAVIECGIGGEYDATNILPAQALTAAAITRLGVDHVAMLGGTVEEIAWHKAGVLKEGVRGFTVRLPGQEGTMDVLRARAREKGAALVEIDGEEVEKWEGVGGASLSGEFQKYNMALAVAVARAHLGKESDGLKLGDLSDEEKEALRSAWLKGRGEMLQRDGVDWFIDGAHTADSLGQVVKLFMSSRPRHPGERRVLLFNQQERAVAPLVAAIVQGARQAGEQFDVAVFTTNDATVKQGARDAPAQEVAMESMRETSPQTESSTWDNVTSAVDHIKALAREAGGPCRVCVIGSFHLVRAVLQVLDPNEVE